MSTSKMLQDSFFRRSPNCSKFSLLVKSKDPLISDYQFSESISGRELTEDYFLEKGCNFPILLKESKETIDLKVPNNVTSLSDIAKIVGPGFQVKIIDVGSQHEIEGWTIGDYAQYLEQRGKMHKVLNMITLEASATPITSQLLAPSVVRNLDWIDLFWPFHRRARGGDYPRVQKYILAGMGGSYTDFHVDFGGTSVWLYHVLAGEKIFYVIPPTEANLRAYRSWITSADQDSTYFPDTLIDTKQCQRIKISAGQTLFLPGGWIHSVFTPIDSLVYGGNFLSSSSILRQLQIHQLETTSRVPKKYLFPYFKQMVWYALCCSLQRYRHDHTSETSQPPPPYPSILDHPRVVFQWIYLIKVCDIWVTDEGQLSEDKAMFEEIAFECYDKSEDLETKKPLLPLQVIQDWWEVFENHPFTLPYPCSSPSSGPSPGLSPSLSGFSSSGEYESSLRRLAQQIRNISNNELDLLCEKTFELFPFYEAYLSFGSKPSPSSGDSLSHSQEIKPERKIRLKLVSGETTSGQESDGHAEEEERDGEEEELRIETTQPLTHKPSIKLKLTLPPPPSSGRSRKSSTTATAKTTPSPSSGHPSDPAESAPLSRTRGKRLSLSFLQSVTDIDVALTDPDQNQGRDQDMDQGREEDETWLEDEGEEDFLNDDEVKDQFRSDQIADFLDDDEFETTSGRQKNKKRKIDHRVGMSSSTSQPSSTSTSSSSLPFSSSPLPTPLAGNKKSRSKLGPGAALRKRLSGKYL